MRQHYDVKGASVSRLSLLVPIAVALCACGARSELLTEDGRVVDASEPTPRPLPPGPPSCDDVDYRACVAWPEPVVVSRPQDSAAIWADVAWQGSVHLVAYDLIDDDVVRVATVDDDGRLLWNELVGEQDHPRIAYHREHQRGVVATGHGLRWIGSDGVPIGSFAQTDPSNISSDRVSHDVFATTDGFGLIVAPTSDPGNVSLAVFGDVPPTVGPVSWGVYWPDNAGPAIEHATGADGLVHRFAIESGGGGELAIRLFEWQGEPMGPVGPAYDLGSGTTFNDGLVTDGDTSFIQRSSNSVMIFLELTTSGDKQIHQLLLDGYQSSAPHVERLGTRNGLRDIVVADRRIIPGAMSVARFDPDSSSIDGAIEIGPEGQRPRISRTSRGLAVAWVDFDTGEVLLNVLDCCTAPGGP